jgi:hypothetical protein
MISEEEIDSFSMRLQCALKALKACPNKTSSSAKEIEEYLVWEDLSQESGPKPPGFPKKMDKPYSLLLQDVERLFAKGEEYDEGELCVYHMYSSACTALFKELRACEQSLRVL